MEQTAFAGTRATIERVTSCVFCHDGAEEVDLRDHIVGVSQATWVCFPCWREHQKELEYSVRFQTRRTHYGAFGREAVE